MISTLDIAWAAGFLEGEGSFLYYKGTSPSVTAAQNQKEPLDRLVKLFGGHLWLKPPTGFSKLPIWTWKLPARRSMEVAMTLYVLMSPKRQEQIESMIRQWRAARLMRVPGDMICTRGHPLTGYNAQRVKGKYLHCRTCKNDLKRQRRAEAKLVCV